jgi:hypothetical protein
MVSLCFNSIFCPVVVTMNAYAYQEGISFVLAFKGIVIICPLGTARPSGPYPSVMTLQTKPGDRADDEDVGEDDENGEMGVPVATEPKVRFSAF